MGGSSTHCCLSRPLLFLRALTFVNTTTCLCYGVCSLIQTGEAVLSNDCYDSKNFNSMVDADTGFHTQTMICAPIFSQHHTKVGACLRRVLSRPAWLAMTSAVVFARVTTQHHRYVCVRAIGYGRAFRHQQKKHSTRSTAYPKPCHRANGTCQRVCGLTPLARANRDPLQR